MRPGIFGKGRRRLDIRCWATPIGAKLAKSSYAVTWLTTKSNREETDPAERPSQNYSAQQRRVTFGEPVWRSVNAEIVMTMQNPEWDVWAILKSPNHPILESYLDARPLWDQTRQLAHPAGTLNRVPDIAEREKQHVHVGRGPGTAVSAH